jgi:hypothetical protein
MMKGEIDRIVEGPRRSQCEKNFSDRPNDASTFIACIKPVSPNDGLEDAEALETLHQI